MPNKWGSEGEPKSQDEVDRERKPEPKQNVRKAGDPVKPEQAGKIRLFKGRKK